MTPWLRYLQRECKRNMHFWPFDGWGMPQGHRWWTRKQLITPPPTLADSTQFPRALVTSSLVLL